MKNKENIIKLSIRTLLIIPLLYSMPVYAYNANPTALIDDDALKLAIIIVIISIIASILVKVRSKKVRISKKADVDSNVTLQCSKCGNVLNVNGQFCPKCGATLGDNNAQVILDSSPIVGLNQTFLQTEKKILRNLIIDELRIQGENEKSFTTNSLNTKANILVIILGITTLLFTIMYFFNYSLILCLGLELVTLLIYCLMSKRFNALDVLTRQAIKFPNEDISNLIRNIKIQKYDSFIGNKLKSVIVILIALILPTIFFFNPRMIYTRYKDGYSVLRYTRGIIEDNDIINIPNTYKNKKVLSISESAFKNSDVEQIILPYGLESIKTKAFYNAKKLAEIDIPSTVMEIRSSAFENCINLTIVKLHNGLKEIRGSAFKNNINLIYIELPETLEYLGAGAFSHSSIVKITIPKNVIEINGKTFENCKSLIQINMHDDIISIHGEAFVGASNLPNIILPSKITEIRGNTFEGCSSLKSIVIPEGVTRIGGHAFEECSSLKSIVIPEGVTEIGGYAFKGCSSLKSIVIPEGVTRIGGHTFNGCRSLSYVSIPSTVREIGSSAFRKCYSLNSVKVPYNAVINERAFKESPTSIERY